MIAIWHKEFTIPRQRKNDRLNERRDGVRVYLALDGIVQDGV